MSAGRVARRREVARSMSSPALGPSDRAIQPDPGDRNDYRSGRDQSLSSECRGCGRHSIRAWIDRRWRIEGFTRWATLPPIVAKRRMLGPAKRRRPWSASAARASLKVVQAAGEPGLGGDFVRAVRARPAVPSEPGIRGLHSCDLDVPRHLVLDDEAAVVEPVDRTAGRAAECEIRLDRLHHVNVPRPARIGREKPVPEHILSPTPPN